MSNLTPEEVAVIKQSPRSADVTDVENLCDAYESQAAKIAELERERDTWKDNYQTILDVKAPPRPSVPPDTDRYAVTSDTGPADEWFRVEVSDEHGQIVAIEPGMLAGRDIDDAASAKIKKSIAHLSGFIGSGGDIAYELQSPEPDTTLAKRQPCGCVVCTCENDDQCQGCGAKHCGTHLLGEFPARVLGETGDDRG